MKEGKGRNRTGSLYRRWKRKRYRLGDSRAKGQGTIYLRYTVGGKTIVTSLETASEEEARKKQQELMKPLELATAAEALEQTEIRLKRVHTEQHKEWEARNPPLKLSEAWTAYLNAQNRPCSGQRTLEGYASQFKKFKEWLDEAFPGAVYMKEIGTREAEAYASYLTERKFSPSSYNQNLNTLTLIWSVLSEKAQTEENPFAWDKQLRKGIHRRSIKAEAHQRRKRPLTIDEIEKLLKKAKGDYRTLIMILVCTGQRLVDGVKLEWKAIDFEKRIIKLIPQKTSKRTGTAVYIPLFTQLEAELTKRRKRGRYVLPKLVAQYAQDSSSVSKDIKEIFTDAKIQTAKETELETGRVITDVGAHSLRHTFVTIARAAGLPDPFIRQITGHSSQEMVDHYTQFSEEMVAALAGKLLGTAGTQKALPAPFSEAAKDPVPGWVKGKAGELVSLVEKITGKGNEARKAQILGALKELS
jgi:integrase